MTRRALRAGEIAARTGSTTGVMRNIRKGDVVVEVNSRRRQDNQNL